MMRAPLLLLAVASLLALSPPAVHAAPPGPGWTLVFNDEFDFSGAPDPRKWSTCHPDNKCYGGAPYSRASYHTASQAYVKPSWLFLFGERCILDWAGCTPGYNWNAGMVSSFGHFHFLYGYMEIRWQIPHQKGFHPTFWAMPVDRTWPPEIDVVEFKGSQPATALMNLHWMDASGGDAHVGSSYTGPDFSTGFHTFGVHWEPGRMRWFIDGTQRFSTTSNIPQKLMYVLATLEIGQSNFDGYPNAGVEADGAYVEWIRVWQKCDGCDCHG